MDRSSKVAGEFARAIGQILRTTLGILIAECERLVWEKSIIDIFFQGEVMDDTWHFLTQQRSYRPQTKSLCLARQKSRSSLVAIDACRGADHPLWSTSILR